MIQVQSIHTHIFLCLQTWCNTQVSVPGASRTRTHARHSWVNLVPHSAGTWSVSRGCVCRRRCAVEATGAFTLKKRLNPGQTPWTETKGTMPPFTDWVWWGCRLVQLPQKATRNTDRLACGTRLWWVLATVVHCVKLLGFQQELLGAGKYTLLTHRNGLKRFPCLITKH